MRTSIPQGSYLAIGLALGSGIGTAVDNLAIGIAIGVALGLLAESWNRKLPKGDPPE